jgi:hypothetical protein
MTGNDPDLRPGTAGVRHARRQTLARQLTEAVARRTPGAGIPGTHGVPGSPDAASVAETADGPAADAAREIPQRKDGR